MSNKQQISPRITSLITLIVRGSYEQLLHTLMETEPIEVTSDMITPELLDELEMLENLSQKRICEACLYKQLEHASWCYKFKEMPKDCHRFRKGEK